MFSANLSKKVFVCLCACVLFLSSCKKEKEDEVVKETTVEEDKANVKTSLNSGSSSVSGMKESTGIKAFINFYDIDNGEVNNEDWADAVFTNLEDMLDVSALDTDNPQFDYQLNKGEYTYVSETGEWTKKSSDMIIFNFPADESSTTNNAQLVLTKYVDTEVNSFNEMFYFPTGINGYLKVDGKEVFTMNMDAVWNAELPTSMNYVVTSGTYSMVLSGQNNGDKIFTANYAIKNNGVTEIGASASVTMKNSNYDNWTEDDIVMANIEMTISELVLKINIDIAELYKLDEVTEDQMNLYTDGQVFFAGEKVADLEFRKDGDVENTYLVYKDGTSELIEDVLKDMLDDLEKAFEPILGDEVVLD